MTIAQVDYSCDVSLKNAGVSNKAVIEKVCGANLKELPASLWGVRFFTKKENLAFDGGISGAPAFVRKIASETSSFVIYLSGRNSKYLHAATELQLQRHGFYGFEPLRPEEKGKAQVITKPDNSTQGDADFKSDVLTNAKAQYEVIAAFDDSLSNANMFAKNLEKGAVVVRPTADIYNRKDLHPRVLQITDYISSRFIDRDGFPQEFNNEAYLEEIIAAAKVYYQGLN